MNSQAIHCAFGPTSLGTALLGLSANGICALFLGDDATALSMTLRKRFPRRSVYVEPCEQSSVQEEFNRVRALIDNPGRSPALVLDVQGTEFQQEVWSVLRGIPAGETLTYAQVAQRLNKPRAVRAVASACAANRIAVLIPCHRVIRSDGGLSGYRWGVERKRALLARESNGVA